MSEQTVGNIRRYKDGVVGRVGGMVGNKPLKENVLVLPSKISPR